MPSPLEIMLDRANHPLTLAAPDLLEFAELVARSACLDQVNGGTCICYSCKAKAAIAKAGGGPRQSARG